LGQANGIEILTAKSILSGTSF